jgi:hypothetical protein
MAAAVLGPLSGALTGLLGWLVARKTKDHREDVGAELREIASEKVNQARQALEADAARDATPNLSPDDQAKANIERAVTAVAVTSAESSARDTNLYTRYADEAITRSKISFWIAHCFGIVGVMTILTGVILAFISKLDVSIVTGVSGLVETSIAALLYKRADVADNRAAKWFDKAAINLDESDSFQRAMDVSRLVEDPIMRDRVRVMAGLSQLFPGRDPQLLIGVLEARGLEAAELSSTPNNGHASGS